MRLPRVQHSSESAVEWGAGIGRATVRIALVALAIALPGGSALADVTVSSSASVVAQTTDFFVLPGTTVSINAPSQFTSFDKTATADVTGHAGVRRVVTTHQKTTIVASGDAATVTSSGEFSIEHLSTDPANLQNIVSKAEAFLNLNICVTQASTFRVSATGSMEAPTTTFDSGRFKDNPFAGGFVGVVPPEGGLRVLGSVHTDEPNRASGSFTDSGELAGPSCSPLQVTVTMDFVSPLACKAGASAVCVPPDTPPNPPPTARGQYQVTLQIGPRGPDGNVFRWIGPTQGGFGNDQNWDPTGVPAFVPDTRSDTALFQDVEARVDVNALANLAAPATGGRAGTVPGCAGPITRTIGRLLLDAKSDVTLVHGALALDGISLADPALTLQDQGLLHLGDATICVLDAAIGASGRPSFAFVEGPGGVLQTRERLSIGVDGKGTLTVRDGGIATSEEVRIGDGNAAGFADVSNATWHTGNLAVGFHSPGELTIENAGLVESEQGFVQFDVPVSPVARFGGDPAARCLGRTDGSGVEVRGALSTWRLQHLEIGGGGCVEVRDHGLLDAIAGDSALGEVQIATTTNGEATLAIDNARVTTASTMIVGDRGSGQLEIVDHDLGATRVQVSGLIVGRSLPGEEGGGQGVVTVRGDLFTDDDLLVTDTINVADEHGIGELSIQPRARVATATSALVSPDGGIGEVTLLGDPQTADPETKTRWNIGTSLQVGIDGFSIPTGTITIADAAINVGSPSAAGQVTIRQSGVVIGRGQRINLIRTNGGTIRNDGQIFGPVTLDGSYDPASTGAIVSQNAAPTPPPPAPLSPAEARAIKVPPLPQGALVVTGDADFAGTTLVLQFLNGFAPRQGDVLPVVQVGGQVTHGFAAVQVLGLAPGATFDVDAASGTATAVNDTVALPAVTISAKATLKESEKKGLKVKLTRTGPKTAPLTVHYRVRGSARSGIDFGALPGVLTIPVKKKSATFLVRPIADGFIEPAETIAIEVLPGDDYAPSLLSKVTITLVSTEKKPKKR